MIHSKTSGDTPSAPAPDYEFQDAAAAMGMSLWRNAQTGKYTDPATQSAYDNWKKNKRK